MQRKNLALFPCVVFAEARRGARSKPECYLQILQIFLLCPPSPQLPALGLISTLDLKMRILENLAIPSM